MKKWEYFLWGWWRGRDYYLEVISGAKEDGFYKDRILGYKDLRNTDPLRAPCDYVQAIANVLHGGDVMATQRCSQDSYIWVPVDKWRAVIYEYRKIPIRRQREFKADEEREKEEAVKKARECRNKNIDILERIEREFNYVFSLRKIDFRYSIKDKNIDLVKDPEECLKVIDEIYNNLLVCQVIESRRAVVVQELEYIRDKLWSEYQRDRLGLE